MYTLYIGAHQYSDVVAEPVKCDHGASVICSVLVTARAPQLCYYRYSFY